MFCLLLGAGASQGFEGVDSIEEGLVWLFREELQLIPESVRSWATDSYRLVSVEAGEPEFQVIERDNLLFAVWGEVGGLDLEALVDGSAPERAGELVEQMRQVEGAFGALLFEHAAGRLRLWGDVGGQHVLRYVATSTGQVYVSSHDIGLFAAGALTPEIDDASLASIRAVGWSLGGASLFTGIEVCHPTECVVLSEIGSGAKGALTCQTLPDPVGRSGESLESMALNYLSRTLEGCHEVVVEVSAGYDSRASLAAALAVRSAEGIRAFSEGPASSLDVIVGRQVCKSAGVRFEHCVTQGGPTDSFTPEWTRAAVTNNGHIDVSVLASRKTPSKDGADAVVCGDGGEIYRGYFYPYRPMARFFGDAAVDPGEIISRKLMSNFPADVSLETALCIQAKLRASVGRVSEISAGVHGVLDRFYRTERFGIWNQKLARDQGASQRLGPFYSRRAMGHAALCPGPMGWTNHLHYDLIAHYLTPAMEIPINGEASVAHYGGGAFNTMMLEGVSLTEKVRRRLRGRLGGQQADLSSSRHTTVRRLLTEALTDDTSLVPADWLRQLGPVRDAMFDRPGIYSELGALRCFQVCRRLAERLGARSSVAWVDDPAEAVQAG